MNFALALLVTSAITSDAIRLNYEPTKLNQKQNETLIPWHCTWNMPCADYNPYENLKCSKQELARIRVESKAQKGLIVSGQGGSCTRVAQQISEIVGTYNWGDVDDTTKDSWAVRWGGAATRHAEVFAATGHVDYDPASTLPAKLLVDVEDQACRTLMIADRMAHRENVYHPWALKEPALRMMLPVFDEVVNFKFVHVTRDIRCISSHKDISDDSDMKLSADRDLFAKYADKKLTDETINLARTDASTNQGMLDVSGLKKALKAQPWTPEEQKWIKFAHVWAAVEKKLHSWWTEKRPDDYYLMSEHSVPSKDNLERAKRFAAFLGDDSPSISTLQKMSNVWEAPECDDKHWAMMHKILTAEENKEIKETMESLGYYI